MTMQLLLKYLKCNTSAREEQQVRQWLADDPDGSHLKQYEEVHLMFEGMSVYGRKENLSPAEVQAKFERRFAVRFAKWAAAAAVVAGMLFGTALYVKNDTLDTLASNVNKIYVPDGKTMELTLEDGTSLWLNSGTEIEYPAVFSRKSREVRLLRGEAMFDVAHDADKPFFVRTFASDVQVLGTKFVVEADEENSLFSTALLRGSVKVSSNINEGDCVVLTPNQKVSMADGHLYVSDLSDSSNITCWKDGLLNIAGVPFDQLMRKIETAFGVKVLIMRDEVPEVRYLRGKVRISDGVDHAFEMLSKASDFKWEHDIESNSITIF